MPNKETRKSLIYSFPSRLFTHAHLIGSNSECSIIWEAARAAHLKAKGETAVDLRAVLERRARLFGRTTSKDCGDQRAAMSFFGFGQSADIDIVLNDAETRKKAEHKSEDGRKDNYFLFFDGETVSGKVNVTLKNPGKRLEHNGIKVEFVGQIGEQLVGLRFTVSVDRSHQSIARQKNAHKLTEFTQY
ncbi:hypothetical protein ILYODFUR_035645 [Ilyodon furcidens]|uniref:Uncharacterized protein n=1 Tax=Ilyodon furcidens TaxID=33524 RepID=A0ABV0U1L3_9TELE